MKLAEHRMDVEEIDDKLIELIHQRMEATKKIFQAKKDRRQRNQRPTAGEACPAESNGSGYRTEPRCGCDQGYLSNIDQDEPSETARITGH